jgi:glutamate racemase
MLSPKRSFKKIGIFDSGLGGLSVLRPLLAEYPAEYIYFADTAHLPYGSKTPDEIKNLSKKIVLFLQQFEIECCIVACHTICSVAFNYLQEQSPIPFFGVIDLVVKNALRTTINNRIGVIATSASIASHAHKNGLLQVAPHVTVIEQACPRIVPVIEQEGADKALLRGILHEDLAIMRKFTIDTLILGSTHYPLVADIILEILGPGVALIAADGNISDAFLSAVVQQSTTSFYVSGDSEEFKQKTKQILNWDLPAVEQVNL